MTSDENFIAPSQHEFESELFSDILQNFPQSEIPCIRMLIAMIHRAVLDSDPMSTEKKVHRRSAAFWLRQRNDYNPPPFSYHWICIVLGVDPDQIQVNIKKRLVSIRRPQARGVR